MKTLKDYMYEASILDIEGTLDSGGEAIKKGIENWIKANYRFKDLNISDNPNNDGKYEVSADFAIATNIKNMTHLTNDLFVWKEIKKYFYCAHCNYLKSLEGAPKNVGKDFDCSNCHSLKTLEGAPEKVGGDCICNLCDNLISLKGATKEVYGSFFCSWCKSLTSLKGAPEKVGGKIYCRGCKSLKSKDVPASIKIKSIII